MSKIDELIAQYCPDGVEWRKLGEIAILNNTGVDKKIIKSEKEVYLLNFVDVFHNQYINSGTPNMIVSASDKKILDCNILKGDIFITPSSEIISEIGQSAMAIEDIPGAVYSYHIMRIRIYDHNKLNPSFLNYLFYSNDLKKQIRTKAQGITRFGLTKPKWESLDIPIPPLPVQEAIVEILDKFTALEAELEAELEARTRQYEFYRNELLSFDGKDVEWKTFNKIGVIKRGVAFTKKQASIGVFPVVANASEPICFHNEYNRTGEFVVIARSGANAGLISYWNEELFLTDAFSLHPDVSILNTKFLYYYLKKYQRDIHLMKKGSGVPHVRASDFELYNIPVPSIEEQNRTVAILDKFDALVNDISTGLPAEIKARREQYEYYRGKLLSFEPKSA